MPLITGEHHLHLKTGLDVFVIFNDKWQQVVMNKAIHLSRVEVHKDTGGLVTHIIAHRFCFVDKWKGIGTPARTGDIMNQFAGLPCIGLNQPHHPRRICHNHDDIRIFNIFQGANDLILMRFKKMIYLLSRTTQSFTRCKSFMGPNEL